MPSSIRQRPRITVNADPNNPNGYLIERRATGTNEPCPRCGIGKTVGKQNRSSRVMFWACSNFNKGAKLHCTWKQSIPELNSTKRPRTRFISPPLPAPKRIYRVKVTRFQTRTFCDMFSKIFLLLYTLCLLSTRHFKSSLFVQLQKNTIPCIKLGNTPTRSKKKKLESTKQQGSTMKIELEVISIRVTSFPSISCFLSICSFIFIFLIFLLL